MPVIPGNADYALAQHCSFPAQSLVYQQYPSGKILSSMDHVHSKNKRRKTEGKNQILKNEKKKKCKIKQGIKKLLA